VDPLKAETGCCIPSPETPNSSAILSMEKQTWKSKAKNDLIIEVWEFLDCESIGAKEISAIGQAVREQFGDGAVDNPMIIARLLADEGAELRHPEIMALFVNYEISEPYDAMLRGLLRAENLKQALGSVRDMENFRRKFTADKDKKGLHRLREIAVRGKKEAVEKADDARLSEDARRMQKEIAVWFSLWLETPELFENWVAVRKKSPQFLEYFPDFDTAAL
jgi:hypothetical protein